MRELNRKTLDRLLGSTANDDLFEYICSQQVEYLSIGYDPLLREFYAFEDAQINASQREHAETNALPHLKVLLRSMYKTSKANTRCFDIPLWVLQSPPADHWVYKIAFGPASDEAKDLLSHPSFDAFRVRSGGYVGMTSRLNPFTRFDEHYLKARNGAGHLLHKAWRAISEQTEVITQFSIIGTAPTRQKAFDLEEQLVDDLGTVAPGGLNVISGGMKGIREMWRLGLMSRGEKPTDENRERALTLLESERSPVAAHYRSGHIRNLPERCAARTTWVSPCWVGMKVNENE